MSDLNISAAEIWMFIGFVFILLEISQLPGFGFLFVGLGSLCTSIFLDYYDSPIETYQQVVIFLIFTIVNFAILWKPLKNFLYNKNPASKDYNDMIGSDVEIWSSEARPNALFQVKWSGTYMNARLEDEEKNHFKKGDHLKVKKVDGNVVVVGSEN